MKRFGAALLATVAIPSLRAGETDNKVAMTFSGPVEIPGQVLPAGTYIFKSLGEDTNVVVIMNKDETKPIRVVLPRPVITAKVPEKVRVRFAEDTGNKTESVPGL